MFLCLENLCLNFNWQRFCSLVFLVSRIGTGSGSMATASHIPPRMWFTIFCCFFMNACSLVVRVPGYRSIGLGVDSRLYQIIWEVVDLEQGPLSLVITTEELLGRNSSGSILEIRKYVHRDPLCWPCDTLYPQNLALTSPSLCWYSSVADKGHRV
jgi:hypothetical protein